MRYQTVRGPFLKVACALPIVAMCAPLRAATLTVTSSSEGTAIDGVLTLREAIISVGQGSDINPDASAQRSGNYGIGDEIRFSIGQGAQVIHLTSALPEIRAGLVIDGSSQPGWLDAPVIALDGTAAGGSAKGLTFAGDGGAIAIELFGFAAGGVLVTGHGSLLIDGFESGNTVLWNHSASAPITVLNHVNAHDNGGYGLEVGSEGSAIIGGGLFSTNLAGGINVAGGLSATGTEVAENTNYGVRVNSNQAVTLASCNIHGALAVADVAVWDDRPNSCCTDGPVLTLTASTLNGATFPPGTTAIGPNDNSPYWLISGTNNRLAF